MDIWLHDAPIMIQLCVVGMMHGRNISELPTKAASMARVYRKQGILKHYATRNGLPTPMYIYMRHRAY